MKHELIFMLQKPQWQQKNDFFLHKRNMQSTKNDFLKKEKKKVAWKESSEHNILFFFKSKQQDRVLLFCQQVLQMKRQNELFVHPCHIEVFHDLTPLSTVRHHLSVPSKKVTNHCFKKKLSLLWRDNVIFKIRFRQTNFFVRFGERLWFGLKWLFHQG